MALQADFGRGHPVGGDGRREFERRVLERKLTFSLWDV